MPDDSGVYDEHAGGTAGVGLAEHKKSLRTCVESENAESGNIEARSSEAGNTEAGTSDSRVTGKNAGVLDEWTAEKIGCSRSRQFLHEHEHENEDVLNKHEEVLSEKVLHEELLRENLNRYTEKKIYDTLSNAVENSTFYRQRYGDKLTELRKIFETYDTNKAYKAYRTGQRTFFDAFAELPFTTADDLRENEMDLLCVKPGEISRIVTLNTGGSTGKPKRIYFTEEDQQLTVDFFEHGMQLMADSSDNVLILMPARMPGSIGRLLSQGIKNFGASTIEYGLPDMKPAELTDSKTAEEAEKILELIKQENVTGIVALPTHMAMLAEVMQRKCRSILKQANIPEVSNDICRREFAKNIGTVCSNESCLSEDSLYERISSVKWVLLSAEYISKQHTEKIAKAFNCKVYEHYGMTEMGLGCAVSCGCGEGYHVRETDLYIEIIDPKTGKPAEDGQAGEIVFTTLTRKGMPFIRYRTGDCSRWITESCSCGSILKRLDKVGPRDAVKGYLR